MTTTATAAGELAPMTAPPTSHRRTARRVAVIVGICLSLATSACGTNAIRRASSPRAITARDDNAGPVPPGDVYHPPDPLPPGRPGSLIWATKVPGIDIRPAATIWRILYHSRTSDDRDIAVSGFAIVPANDAGDAHHRLVYAWAHGTVGLADRCAPSHDIRENLPPYGGQQLERGAVIVATDYEGLGTPGVPTDTDAVAEGRALLDSAIAAAELPRVGATGHVILAGHSQGGRAALFAAQIAPTYASQLDVVGALALAPGVELPALVASLIASPGRGVALIGAIGLQAAHPDLDLTTLFTAQTVADIPRVKTECVDAVVSRYRSMSPADFVAHDPGSVPEIQRALVENSPGGSPAAAPVFIGHGSADEQVPVALSERLADRYCALGVDVERRVYPGADHGGVIDAAADDALMFIGDRFDPHPPSTHPVPSTCP